MPITIGGSISFCGQRLSADELQLIRQLVHDFTSLSISQLASTVCELLDWRRPNGALKTRECFSFLQELGKRGWLDPLPPLRATAPRGARSVSVEQCSDPQPQFSGPLAAVRPLQLQLLNDKAERRLFQQYLHRYHYLGYRIPVGAQLRYFVSCRQGRILACLLFTSAAWRMAPRDAWIGWDDQTRRANLSLVVNQSRFLIPLAPQAQRWLAQPQKGTPHGFTANL